MKRLLFLLLLAGLLLLAWHKLDLGPAQTGPRKPPNILLLLLDDLGNNDLAAFGDGTAATPHLDALAREGVRFTRHYAHATCRPARVSLLTGLSASRSGVPPYVRGITPELVTLPEALRGAGYSTHHIGKWHLGHHVVSAYPQHQGFDDWYGFLTALTTRDGSLGDGGSTYQNPWLEGLDRPRARQSGHLTDLLAQAAEEKIRSIGARDQPWFINLWFFAPHKPIEPAARHLQRFDATPEGRYLALVAQVDEAVGRLRTVLQETGQERDTLIVLLSDNGATNSSRNSNRPYIGRKNQYLEGGLRTPLVMYMPGRWAGTEIPQAVFIQDVMPTLLALAGVEPPAGLDGRSLLPLLEGDSRLAGGPWFWDFQIGADARYGVMDLGTGRLVYGSGVQTWNAAEQRFSAPISGDSPSIALAVQRYAAWRGRIRRTRLEAEDLPGGGTSLTGDSYRRTPGFGPWTLQVPLVVGKEGEQRLIQAGILDLTVSGQSIRVQVPGHEFSVSNPDTGCRLLTLGTFHIWNDRDMASSRGYVSLSLQEEELYRHEFALDPGLIRDDYPPLVLSAGVPIPLVVNDFLASDLTGYYRSAAGEEPACD